MNCPICQILLVDTNYLRSHLIEDHSDLQLQHALQSCPDINSPRRGKIKFEFTQEAEELLSQLTNARQLHNQNLLAQRQALNALSKTREPVPATIHLHQRQHDEGGDCGSSKDSRQGRDGLLHTGRPRSAPHTLKSTDEAAFCTCENKREVRRLKACVTKKKAEVADLLQRLKHDVEELERKGILDTGKSSNIRARMDGNTAEGLSSRASSGRGRTGTLRQRKTSENEISNKMYDLCLNGDVPDPFEEDESLLDQRLQKQCIPAAELARASKKDVREEPEKLLDSTDSGSSYRRHNNRDHLSDLRASKPPKNGKRGQRTSRRRGGDENPTELSDSDSARSSSTWQGKRNELSNSWAKTSLTACGEVGWKINGISSRPSSRHSNSQRMRDSSPPSELEWLLYQQEMLEVEFQRELQKLLDHIDQMYHR